MMLDYLNSVKLTQQTPPLTESEIAEILKTTKGGTPLFNVALLNKDTRIISAVPSLEFAPEYQVHTLDDIQRELESSLPVAVWIVTNDGTDDYMHAVVIAGMDNSANKEITFNDPTYGTRQVLKQSRFMSIWQPPGARMVKAKIGRLPRKTLEEWQTQEDTQ